MVKVSNIDFCPYAIPTTDPPGQGYINFIKIIFINQKYPLKCSPMTPKTLKLIILLFNY